MKAYICDECGTQVEPKKSGGYDLTPDNWISVTLPAYKQRDFCSIPCTVSHLNAISNYAANTQQNVSAVLASEEK